MRPDSETILNRASTQHRSLVVRRRTDDKHTRILQAAIKKFARKGYFAARVSEIAGRAAVADGTIDLYFKSKKDALVSLFDDVMAEHIQI